MKVRDLAADLKVKPDILVRFLRKGGVRVGHPDAPIRDSDVARIRMRLERERRAGKGAPADVMRAELKGDKPVSRRRRVRRRRAPVAPAGDVDTPSDAGAEPTGLPIGEAAAPVAAEGVAATVAAGGDGRSADEVSDALIAEAGGEPPRLGLVRVNLRGNLNGYDPPSLRLATTSFSRPPSPSTSSRRRSPAWMWDMPSGVPVQIMSPGLSVI